MRESVIQMALARECADAGVPFFDKRKQDWLRREWPDKSRSGNGETRFNEAWSRTPR